MKPLIDLLTGLFGSLFGLLIQGLSYLIFKDHRYKARYGKHRKVLHRYHKRCGIAIGNKFTSLQSALAGGMMLIGRTGSGKSSKIYKMNLYGAEKTGASYVCLDVAGDLRDDCGRFMVEELEYREDILDFSDAKRSTVRWNPIDNIPLDRVNRFANDFVNINMGVEPKDPIWSLMSASLIGMMVRLLILIGRKDCTNLYNTRHLIKTLQAEPKKVDALVSKFADDTLFLDYRGFLNNDDKFLNSVISNTLASLQQFEDINIIKTTSSSTLDMSSYRHQKKVLFLQNDGMSQSYLSSLNSLFFTAWFSHITEVGIPDKEALPIVFAIDEASSLRMRKDILPLAVSQIRKYRAFGIFGYQSFSQVQDLLGIQGADTLKQNTGNILYLGNQTLNTGQEISRSLGRYSYEDNGVNRDRELLTVEEAMYLDECKNGGLLFSGQERPMRLKKIKAFYEVSKYKKWADMDALPVQEMQHDMPPLLPINELIADVLDDETPDNESKKV